MRCMHCKEVCQVPHCVLRRCKVTSDLGRACPKIKRAIQIFILDLPHTIVHCRKGKVLQQRLVLRLYQACTCGQLGTCSDVEDGWPCPRPTRSCEASLTALSSSRRLRGVFNGVKLCTCHLSVRVVSSTSLGIPIRD